MTMCVSLCVPLVQGQLGMGMLREASRGDLRAPRPTHCTGAGSTGTYLAPHRCPEPWSRPALPASWGLGACIPHGAGHGQVGLGCPPEAR